MPSHAYKHLEKFINNLNCFFSPLKLSCFKPFLFWWKNSFETFQRKWKRKLVIFLSQNFNDYFFCFSKNVTRKSTTIAGDDVTIKSTVFRPTICSKIWHRSGFVTSASETRQKSIQETRTQQNWKILTHLQINSYSKSAKEINQGGEKDKR